MVIVALPPEWSCLSPWVALRVATRKLCRCHVCRALISAPGLVTRPQRPRAERSWVAPTAGWAGGLPPSLLLL